MLRYTGLAAALRAGGASASQSNTGRSLISFAAEVGLAAQVSEALESLPRIGASFTDEQYAWELRGAFRDIMLGKTARHVSFTSFVDTVLIAIDEKQFAEEGGRRILAMRGDDGENRVRSDFVRGHILSMLTMLDEIGEHHIYEPMRWRPYLRVAYQDMKTAAFIERATKPQAAGSEFVSKELLATRLNGIALSTIASYPGPKSHDLEAICFKLGEALKGNDTTEPLNTFLEIWSRAVEIESGIFERFASNKPRSGFFQKSGGEAEARLEPPDLAALAQRARLSCDTVYASNRSALAVNDPIAAEVAASIYCDDNAALPAYLTMPCTPHLLFLCSSFIMAGI